MHSLQEFINSYCIHTVVTSKGHYIGYINLHHIFIYQFPIYFFLSLQCVTLKQNVPFQFMLRPTTWVTVLRHPSSSVSFVWSSGLT